MFEGTGKSFVGALIARTIQLLTKKTILVICYTNHALDQFLDDLLSIGIPEAEIVRLGSVMKSDPKIQELALSSPNQKSSFKLTRTDWDVINLQKTAALVQAANLAKAFETYHRSSLSRADMMDFLEFDTEDDNIHNALLLPEPTDDDMVTIGPNGKKLDQFYLLDQWVRGKDAGLFSASQDQFPEVWSLSKEERNAKISRWKTEIIRERAAQIYSYGDDYNKSLTKISAMYNEKDRRIVQDKRIIACTTTAAAKYVQMIQSASPDVLLVEEAGEILESHILTALSPNTGQAIFIGDHKQLRPKAHFDLSVEKGDGYDLNRSLFERLVMRGFPHQVLSQQHRMRPEISALVRHLTYPKLKDAPTTANRPALRGFQDSLIFLSHEHPEEELWDAPDWRDDNSRTSKENRFEARMTLGCVRYLAQQGYGTSQIVVLTPYLGQLRLLYDVMSRDNDPILNDLDSYDLVRAGLMPAASAQAQKQRLRISTIGKQRLRVDHDQSSCIFKFVDTRPLHRGQRYQFFMANSDYSF